MEDSDSFENILEQVKNSNLNFKLELSPFSAVICLKKSLVKDKFGQNLQATPTIPKNLNLENAYQLLKSAFENALDVNNKLKTELEHHKSTLKKEDTDKVSDFELLKIKYDYLEKELNVKNHQIQEIIVQNKNYKIEIKN
jgi:seryl-tRNA synthetase